jgi:sodium/proline symporter
MSPEAAIITTLVVYKLVLLGIGWWASRRTEDDADFYLGGGKLGPWVAALSAAASSSSAWTLLGVSGAAYTMGLGAVWLFPACLGGFLLNWCVGARPLQRLAKEGGAVTLTELLAADAPPAAARRFTLSASIIILLCLLVYVASQFQAAGETFATTLDMDFRLAVVVGGVIVLIYTTLGGFWAASVTDTIQGLVMAAASIAVPVVALVEVGGPGAMADGLEQAGPQYVDVWNGNSGWTLVAFLVGTLGIGLGYPGQPHVVNRFMALRSEQDVRRGTVITMVWGVVIYGGMLLAGWCGRALVNAIDNDETILLRLTTDLFDPVAAGIIIAAVLSAIMSTADSQLLVCGSTVAYDMPRRQGGDRLVSNRITMVALGVAAIVAAILIDDTIFNTVLFAWSGLGAAFGPLLLVRLGGRRIMQGYDFAALWAGFLLSIVWFYTPALKGMIYELVPAFLLSLVICLLGSRRLAP